MCAHSIVYSLLLASLFPFQVALLGYWCRCGVRMSIVWFHWDAIVRTTTGRQNKLAPYAMWYANFGLKWLTGPKWVWVLCASHRVCECVLHFAVYYMGNHREICDCIFQCIHSNIRLFVAIFSFFRAQHTKQPHSFSHNNVQIRVNRHGMEIECMSLTICRNMHVIFCTIIPN